MAFKIITQEGKKKEKSKQNTYYLRKNEMFSNISLSLLFTWNCNLLFHCWIMAGWKKNLAYIILLTTYTFAERAKQKTYAPVLNCTGFKRDADFIKPSANKWIS